MKTKNILVERFQKLANISESIRDKETEEINNNENIISENKEYGLYVYPTTRADFEKLEKWLKNSDYYAEVDNNLGYIFFPEEKENYDSLETELDNEFNKANISARFEGE